LANQEAINSLKLQIRILEGQLQREWSNTKWNYIVKTKIINYIKVIC
jgi:hypothetical protein